MLDGPLCVGQSYGLDPLPASPIQTGKGHRIRNNGLIILRFTENKIGPYW